MKKITLKKVLASLETLSPKVELPEDIIEKTAAKYIEAYERLTGQSFDF